MTSTFEFISSKTGSTVRFDLTYECKLKKEYADVDGTSIFLGEEETTVGSMLTVSIGDEKIDSCWDPAFWRLIDVKDGAAKKVWGLKIAFTDMDVAAEYEAWLAECMDQGTSAAVKERREVKNREREEETAQYAQSVIAKAEAQREIPAEAEAHRRMREYNEVMNEGGEGYVPHIVSLEEYDWAKSVLGLC